MRYARITVIENDPGQIDVRVETPGDLSQGFAQAELVEVLARAREKVRFSPPRHPKQTTLNIKMTKSIPNLSMRKMP